MYVTLHVLMEHGFLMVETQPHRRTSSANVGAVLERTLDVCSYTARSRLVGGYRLLSVSNVQTHFAWVV